MKYERKRLSTSGRFVSRPNFLKRKFCGRPCTVAHAASLPLAPSTRYRQVKRNGRKQSAHRFVMEQAIGRKLLRSELVHHKNEIKIDNRLENLEVTNDLDHSRHHNQKHPYEKVCSVCGVTFTPMPTKRERAKTCGATECVRAAISRNQATTEWLTIGEERMTLAGWSARTGVKVATIRARMRQYGFTPEKAVRVTGRERNRPQSVVTPSSVASPTASG